MEKQHICDCDMIHEEIVETTRSRMQEETEYQELASLFKMFGDGTRVKILHALELNEMCVCDLAALLGMTKSARIIGRVAMQEKQEKNSTITLPVAPPSVARRRQV